MPSKSVITLRHSVARALRPPPEMRYSDWARENFRLSTNSAAPGRFRPWKFQRGILDAIGDPTIERVSVIKAARVGYSTTLIASLGAVAVNDPCPIILLMPTDDDARGIAVDDVDPAFRDTPALKGIMRVGRYDARNTITQRAMLGGGSLKILSAMSPRNLRRHTAKVLFCDEVDGMKITSEGDPLDLAEKRTLSFADRKIVVGSTPTDDTSTMIGRRYDESDQRVFEVPCPECNTPFEIQWEHIHYAPERPHEAHCACPHCGSLIEERQKPAMVEAGEWRATKPEVRGHAGFRLSALISLFANASWGKLAEEFERARRAGASGLQVFENTVLGRIWSNTIDDVSEHHLMTRLERFGIKWDPGLSVWRVKIPNEVAYITAGVDVQVDRLEITLLGWSEDNIWVLGHEVVRGATNLETTWLELDALLATKWDHPLGKEIGVEAACVDSGDGNRTQYVYDFCGPRQPRKIVPIKGRNGPHPVIQISRTRSKRRAGVSLFLVGVDQVKTDIITTLPLSADKPQAFRFADVLDGEWFKQITSERRKVKFVKGRPIPEFIRIGGRAAEALDCVVYAIAARHLCRFDFDKRREELQGRQEVKSTLKTSLKRLHG
jgi:phage terminase large subunit GpA-like protein